MRWIERTCTADLVMNKIMNPSYQLQNPRQNLPLDDRVMFSCLRIHSWTLTRSLSILMPMPVSVFTGIAQFSSMYRQPLCQSKMMEKWRREGNCKERDAGGTVGKEIRWGWWGEGTVVTGEGCRRDSGKWDPVRVVRGENCGYRRGMQEGQWEKKSCEGDEEAGGWLRSWKQIRFQLPSILFF